MINIDWDLWKKAQDNLSRVSEYPLVTIDRDGNEKVVSNDYPFFCQMLKNKSNACKSCRIQELIRSNHEIEIFECHAGLTNIMAPLKEADGEKKGAILMTSIPTSKNEKYFTAGVQSGIEPDELKDELNKMEVVNEERVGELAKFVKAFARTIPYLAKQSSSSNQVINELNVLRRLSNILDSSLDLEVLSKNIIEFFIGAFKLINCSITLFDDRIKFSNSETDIKMEANLMNLIKQTNHLVDIRDSKNTILLEAGNYSGAILALPLRVGTKSIGMISIYSEKPVDNISLFSTLSEQVSLGMMNALNYKHVSEESVTDKLTTLYNRGYFNTSISKELSRSARLGKPISLIILDVDNFKRLNDSCGHLKGDQVLKDVSGLIKSSIRAMDTPFRYGGEEFVVLLPETDSKEALAVAERVRKSVEQNNFIATGNFDGRVTISLGLVTCNNSKSSPEKLLQIADECLYKAKNSGKNKSVGSLIIDERLSPININDANELGKY
ncbi:MAG: diguanylate cyclase [Candidatus Nanoarchaeia archaeon]|nr:diguanylate cyclase [Candidatus Nanoarchaeia archaeon]